MPEEYHRMRRDQVLFTYLHLAASRECTDAPVDSGITAIAYEDCGTTRRESASSTHVGGRVDWPAGQVPRPDAPTAGGGAHGESPSTRSQRWSSWAPGSPATTPPPSPWGMQAEVLILIVTSPDFATSTPSTRVGDADGRQ